MDDHHVYGTYSVPLVLLSIIVSVLASYSAFRIAERVVLHRGNIRSGWIIAGSCVMGLGIWSMHFIGMLAFHFSFEVSYDPILMVASMLLPVGAVYIALRMMTKEIVTIIVTAAGGIIMAVAITGMHYVGMAAMIIPAQIRYDPLLVVISFLIAGVASFLSLFLSFRFRRRAPIYPRMTKLAGGIAAGIAVAGMHYTGMYAASFTVDEEAARIGGELLVEVPMVNNFGLAYLIGAAAVFILLLIILSLFLEQKMNVRRAQLNERRYHFIFEYNPDSVCLFDTEGNLLRVNPAVEVVTGYAYEELKQQSILSIILPEDRYVMLSRFRKVKGGKSQTVECSIRHRDGHLLYVSTTMVPLFVNGEISDIYTITNDFTEQKKLELQLREATYTKNEFLANMSHEIRTPLNAIVGLNYLVLGTKLTPIQHEYVSRVQMASRSLLHLINDVMDFSKIEAGKMALESVLFNLHDVIRESGDLVSLDASEKKHTLFFIAAPDVPSCLIGDAFRLKQVLINLVSNAIKFTHEGMIVVRIDLIAAEESSVTLGFSVEDNGIGLTETQKLKLFQSFSQADGSTTRKYGGTGLGLAISQQIVRMMSGDIRVKSEAGVGSVFSFDVKLEYKVPLKGTSVTDYLMGKRILILNHSREAYKLLREILAACQAKVLWIEDSRQYKAALDKRLGHIDLVIVDWATELLTGYVWTRWIEENHSPWNIPSIVLYSSLQQEEVQAIQALPKKNYRLVEKPVYSVELLQVIKQLLDAERTLPAEARMHDNVSARSRGGTGILTGARILVIEDNEINGMVLKGILAKENVELHLFTGGKAALHCMKQLPQHYFDLVLTDLQMPEMDGFEAAKNIRMLDPHIPIIALSAYAMEESKEQIYAVQMNDFITKPIDPAGLVSVIAKWIGMAGKQSAAAIDNVIPGQGEGTYVDIALLRERLAFNEQLVQRVLRTFLEEQSSIVDHWPGLALGKQYDELRLDAHNLKGVAGNLSMPWLAQQSAELERAVLKRDDAAILEAVEMIRANWEEVLASIATYVPYVRR